MITPDGVDYKYRPPEWNYKNPFLTFLRGELPCLEVTVNAFKPFKAVSDHFLIAHDFLFVAFPARDFTVSTVQYKPCRAVIKTAGFPCFRAVAPVTVCDSVHLKLPVMYIIVTLPAILF